MGDAMWAIENGLDPFIRPDGEEWGSGGNPKYNDYDEEYYSNYNAYHDAYDDTELCKNEFDSNSIQEEKNRLIEIEISLKKLSDEKEKILESLINIFEEQRGD